MRAIWKFTLPLAEQSHLTMPKGAVLLDVQMQDREIRLWAEVVTANAPELRAFRVFGTGHGMPADMGYSDRYVGTVQQDGFVWHVYEQL